MNIEISKEWCERMARLEGDTEIGAGTLPDPRDAEIARLRAALMLLADAADAMGDATNSGMADEAIREARAVLGAT